MDEGAGVAALDQQSQGLQRLLVRQLQFHIALPRLGPLRRQGRLEVGGLGGQHHQVRLDVDRVWLHRGCRAAAPASISRMRGRLADGGDCSALFASTNRTRIVRSVNLGASKCRRSFVASCVWIEWVGRIEKGTVRITLFELKGRLIYRHSTPCSRTTPAPGWADGAADMLWEVRGVELSALGTWRVG